jgi:hypothetical protein
MEHGLTEAAQQKAAAALASMEKALAILDQLEIDAAIGADLDRSINRLRSVLGGSPDSDGADGHLGEAPPHRH